MSQSKDFDINATQTCAGCGLVAAKFPNELQTVVVSDDLFARVCVRGTTRYVTWKCCEKHFRAELR